MGSGTPVEPDISFDSGAIDAALVQATRLNVYIETPGPEHPGADSLYRELTGLEMEEILLAAWRQQSKGDHTIADLRTTRSSLEADIARLKRQAAEAHAEWDRSRWAKVEIEELEEVQRCLRVLLKVTRKRRNRWAKVAEAWDKLAEWASL